MTHPALQKQLREHLGVGDLDELPPELMGFVRAVESAYQEFDDFRVRLGSALDQGSREVLETNAELLQELTRQRKYLHQVIDLNPHFIFAKDRGGHFTLVNRAVAEAYGTSVENLLGKTDADFNPDPAEVAQFRRVDLEVINTGVSAHIPEEQITDAQGNTRWLETIKRAILSPDGGDTQVLGVATDITERRRAEQRLRQRTETILEHQAALHALALMDHPDWMGSLEAITRTASRALGVARVGVWLFEDNQARLVCESLFEDGCFNSRPGTSLESQRYPRYFEAIAQSRTLAADDARNDPRASEFADEYSIPLGISSLLDVPIRSLGSVVGIVCHEHVGPARVWTPEEEHFAASIADFVALALGASKRRQLEAQLRQSQKMEAIGHLAGGVAHDFNNVLTAILGYSRLILAQIRTDDPLRPQVEQIRQAADRAAQLTGHLLAFGRKQVLNPRILNLNQVVSGMEPMLARIIGEDIRLSTVLAPDLGRVQADPSQIEQVLLNLVVNARDAMPEGGSLVIRTANVLLETGEPESGVAGASGQHIMLSVTDSGIGMNAEIMARIFEPFFTTKEAGRGTGLGLSTVYGVVEQSGGRVGVWSEPGRGATFRIYLPRVFVDEEATAPQRAPSKPAPPLDRTASEPILLVEDDVQVRTLVHRILERQGYRVTEAATPLEAIRIAEGGSERIDLLLTDVVMPGMNGRELFERLCADRPNLKVLYMSGYAEKAFSEKGAMAPGASLIQKPFEPEALVLRIREILDASSAAPASPDSPAPKQPAQKA